jgi:hypothetical protein
MAGITPRPTSAITSAELSRCLPSENVRLHLESCAAVSTNAGG